MPRSSASNHKYQYVTSKLTYKFNQFKADDTSNLTRTFRGLKEYQKLLLLKSLTVAKLIKRISKMLGRPLVILDAGCGMGVALEGILQNNELKPYVSRCIGISKHHFSNIENIMEAHGSRFEYYLGDAYEVLRRNPIQIDLIFDVWGALAYSEAKAKLLQIYYSALNPDGVAMIHHPTPISVLHPDQNDLQEANYLFDALAAIDPDHFGAPDSAVLQMFKTSQRLNLVSLDMINSEMRSTRPDIKVSREKLARGNALAPVVTYQVADIPKRRLRPKFY